MRVRREAILRLVPSAVLAVGGAAVSTTYGNIHSGDSSPKLIALAGVLLFVTFAVAFLRVFTTAIYRFIAGYRLGVSRLAIIQLVLRVLGYIVILLTALNLLGIPIDRLLLGGAVLTIILGVATQQALANFFASIVLVISHPFGVGDEIGVNSGTLGGEYTGIVVDIGLIHTRLLQGDGNAVYLPNAALLSNAAIISLKHKASSE
jgi:small-conductance mechanosensitive channel